MRRAPWLPIGMSLALACETTAVPSITPGGPDDTCTAFCGEQQSRGTLIGPLADCLNQCCANSVARCGEGDASMIDVAQPSEDTGGQDSTRMPDVTIADTTTNPDTSNPDASPDTGSDAETDGGCVTCGMGCCGSNQMCVNDRCYTPCTTASDCTTGCCAPATDTSGNPIGPYVCKQNDAAPYDCCYGITEICGNNYCCVADTNGNQFCSTPCTSSATCGNAQCNTYSFAHSSCTDTSACGP